MCQETKAISCKGLKHLCVVQLVLAGWFWQSILSTISQSSDSWPTWLNGSTNLFPTPPWWDSCITPAWPPTSPVSQLHCWAWEMWNHLLFFFICSLHHSHSLADLQFFKLLLHKNLKSPAKSFHIMWTKWLMGNNDVSSGEAAEKGDADQT